MMKKRDTTNVACLSRYEIILWYSKYKKEFLYKFYHNFAELNLFWQTGLSILNQIGSYCDWKGRNLAAAQNRAKNLSDGCYVELILQYLVIK